MSVTMWMPNNMPKEDIKKVRIIKNSDRHIFLLSHNELILLEVDSEKKEILRTLIAELDGINSEIIDIKVESWANIFVIVVLTGEDLRVFHTLKKITEIATEDDIILKEIQKIELKNNFCKFELIRNEPNELFMITYQIRNETTNNLS